MRLFLICDRYPPEARSVAHLFQDLAEGLAKRSHDVTVITRRPTDRVPSGTEQAAAAAMENGVNVIRLAGLSGSRSIVMRALDQAVFALRVLFSAWRLKRPDIVIVYSPPLSLAVVGSFFSRVTGVPLILNLHDLYPRTAIELNVLRNPWLIRVVKWLERFSYRGVSQFSIPLPGSLDYLVREMGIPKDRVHLIYNWVDTDRINPAIPGEGFKKEHGLDGRTIISYAGVMGYAQDLGPIIECARRLRDEPRLLFLLVGDGVYREKWERLADGLTNVRFMPPLGREAYFESLCASDVCMIILAEHLKTPAIPGKLQNIMAVGRPTLAVVPEGDAARMVRESSCGVVVSTQDMDGLLSAVRQFSSDRELRRKYGENGRKFAERHFALTRALDSIEGIMHGSKNNEKTRASV